MDALVVGAGDVGRWMASVLDGPVAFADLDRSAAEAAANDFGERASVEELDGDSTYDLVVVGVPMRVGTETIAEQAHRAESAIVDCIGSMEGPLSTMDETVPDLERASLHPLFAPEHAPGRVAISLGVSGPTIDTVISNLEAAGNAMVPVEADVHDRAMETIQGRAHAAILAFGLAAESVPEDLATPVFEDLEALRERVTSGSAGVYADIQAQFDGAADIKAAAEELARADTATFESLYDDAG